MSSLKSICLPKLNEAERRHDAGDDDGALRELAQVVSLLVSAVDTLLGDFAEGQSVRRPK